jgi:hypothetical protein
MRFLAKKSLKRVKERKKEKEKREKSGVEKIKRGLLAYTLLLYHYYKRKEEKIY